jgi:hypothetical protein
MPTKKLTKQQTKWCRFDIPPESLSTLSALKRARIPRECYVAIFGAILFETEELKQQFEDAYYHREPTHGTSN